jgi:hypothetical protein
VITNEDFGGLGPEFAKAFFIAATPIFLWMLLMILFFMRRKP